VPSPPTPPAPTAELVNVSVEPAAVDSLSNATGTVTLNTGAPAEGVTIAISSSSSAARTPDAVTVPAGQVNVSFPITTAATDLRQMSTIAGSYNGKLLSTTLTINPRRLTPSFTVISPTRGNDACNVKDNGATLDCDLNASLSQPRDIIATYYWTQTNSGHGQTRTLSHSSSQPVTRPEAGCGFIFISSNDGFTDSSGASYIEMTLSMYFETTTRERSATVTRTVRIYTNHLCGYNF